MSPNRATPPSPSPPSARLSPTPSRSPTATAALPFAPLNPSGLRESHTLANSPESTRSNRSYTSGGDEPTTSEPSRSSLPPARAESTMNGKKASSSSAESANETTGLLGRRDSPDLGPETPHPGACNHGTFSPRIESRTDSIDSGMDAEDRSVISNLLAQLGVAKGGRPGKLRTASTTRILADRHGITNTTAMYFSYYIPFLTWIKQYRWLHLQGDFVAALTMASFYLPMALSYAANLAHLPPINGLYSFVFNPLIYAILGSCPQMVVGPEAAGSLLLGSVVKSSVDAGHGTDADAEMHARVAGVVTGMAGAVIFIAGLTRLGFLDSVLSRPFLRGFISAIGFVIVVDQLISEMGLTALAAVSSGVSHGSSIDKIAFLWHNAKYAHTLTCAVSGISFGIIMTLREVKKRLQPRYPAAAYFPDRFLVVVLAIVLTSQYRWDKYGLEVLGEIKATSGIPFTFRWPFQPSHLEHVRESLSTSFLIALLGFFESSVAAKSLGGSEGQKDMIQGVALSPNRELVALGVANLVGGCFQALPAFGGYGRSKVNASTGGKTPMSSVFLSLMTVITILYLLPAFYYLPKAVLSALISAVAWSLIEEAPHDILFFIRIRGFTELSLMIIIFAATIFYSLNIGMAIGVGLSLLSVIKHSTRPRIQILGRIPGTSRFVNAEDNSDQLEFIEGCLIVKIPEPLTFANTGDLKSRLRRLELYGTTRVHPALPRVRPAENNKNIIFDIHGVTSLDGSGTQVLEEIVRGYCDRGVRVFFSRAPEEGTAMWELFRRSGILETCGGKSHFVRDVGEALRLTEAEDSGDLYANMAGDEGGG